jgi:hypothetical protein
VTGTPAGTFTAVAAGHEHSVALRTDGTLVSWGSDGSGVVSGTPVGTFSAVAAGYAHSVAIRTDGTLVSWGLNGSGVVSGTPVGTFSAVAAGEDEFASVAIRTDGTLAAWGRMAGYSTPGGRVSSVAVTYQLGRGDLRGGVQSATNRECRYRHHYSVRLRNDDPRWIIEFGCRRGRARLLLV